MGVFKLPRVTTTDRLTITPALGELIYDTDLDAVYKGDGVTVGGVLIGDGSGYVESVTGNLVDNTDPINPIVSGVEGVTGTGVDNTDPANPVISQSPYDLTQEGAADADVLTWVAANSRYEPVATSGGVGADANAVHYNAADGKTQSERSQARSNTGSTSMPSQTVSTAGLINDLVTSSNNLIFTGANVQLTGITAGEDGEEMTIYNISGTNLQIFAGNPNSAPPNKFLTGLILPTGTLIRIKYRTSVTRWIFEAVDFYEARYLRKDITDTKVGNLTLSTGSLFMSAAGATIQYNLVSPGPATFNFNSTTRSGTFTLRQNNSIYFRNDVSGMITNTNFYVYNVDITTTPAASSINFGILNTGNLLLNTSTGVKIGTATNEKLAFWNKTPIIQPTTGITGATLVGGGGTTITDTDTFGGYTVAQLAAILINTGLTA
jgi:hypothetical protein